MPPRSTKARRKASQAAATAAAAAAASPSSTGTAPLDVLPEPVAEAEKVEVEPSAVEDAPEIHEVKPLSKIVEETKEIEMVQADDPENIAECEEPMEAGLDADGLDFNDNKNVEEDDVEDEVGGAAEVTEGLDADDAENDEAGEEGDDQIEGAADDIDGLDANGDVKDDKSAGNHDDDSEIEEEDPSIYLQDALPEGRKEKHFEVYIGGLHKEAVEDDLTNIFGVFGEIQAVKIVKHPSTQKSKGFAFIRYARIEDAKKALAELKEGIEVKGKPITISATQANDTLYVGNICKTWTKDQVMEALKSYGVGQIETILVPEDPKEDGKCKGFAFVEFSSHDDAKSAFHLLRKPDAVFGCDVSAKVSFSLTPLHPSEETMLQVKTVYVEGLPKSWGEEEISGFCKKYGEIERVQLSRNLSGKKRKDFGFITFTSRDNAVACVDGINSAQLGEGDIKIKASLAKPQVKGRLAKRGTRGGFKVQKNEEGIKERENPSKKKRDQLELSDKGKSLPKSKFKKKDGSSKPGEGFKVKSLAAEPSKSSKHTKGKKRSGRVLDALVNERPSKKGRPNPRHANSRGRTSRPGNMRGHYAGSMHRYSDLEPHAGYISAPATVRTPYAYERARAGGYDSRPRIAPSYSRGAMASHPSYYDAPPHSEYAGYEASYGYPSGGGSSSSYAPRGSYYYY